LGRASRIAGRLAETSPSTVAGGAILAGSSRLGRRPHLVLGSRGAVRRRRPTIGGYTHGTLLLAKRNALSSLHLLM
jgi:hypothetical protein